MFDFSHLPSPSEYDGAFPLLQVFSASWQACGQTLGPSLSHFHPLPRGYIHWVSTLKRERKEDMIKETFPGQVSTPFYPLNHSPRAPHLSPYHSWFYLSLTYSHPIFVLFLLLKKNSLPF